MCQNKASNCYFIFARTLSAQCRCRRYAQAGTGITFQLGGGGIEPGQHVAHIGAIAHTETGEGDVAVDPNEQRGAQKLLKRLDAMADGRLGDMQFFPGLQKACQTRCRLERGQIV